MRISYLSADVCSSDLGYGAALLARDDGRGGVRGEQGEHRRRHRRWAGRGALSSARPVEPAGTGPGRPAMSVKQAVLGAVLIVAGIVAWLSMYVVSETEQTLVIRFGEPIRVVQEPGLAFKWPWETIVRYDDRVLRLAPPAAQVILADKRRLDVDSVARVRSVHHMGFFGHGRA